jgi:hypothetical protein
MKKNTKLIIGAAVIGTGAYLIYNKIRKAKKDVSVIDIEEKQEAEKIKTDTEKQRQNANKIDNSLQNPRSFKSKVAKVQLFLGVATDGIVGPQTLLALSKKLPKYTMIKDFNIDFILNDIANKKNLQFN